jgi:NADH-quinone oxidoreductase subunit L
MMALSGVPIFFSGFWSKDEILHAAHGWSAPNLPFHLDRMPFYLGVLGALLTAFYMTRQMCYVFFGSHRGAAAPTSEQGHAHGLHAGEHAAAHEHGAPHESPWVMTMPLVLLAVFAVLLGFIGTPAWPWFQDFLTGEHAAGGIEALLRGDIMFTMLTSVLVVLAGISLGWSLYGGRDLGKETGDILERLLPPISSDLFKLVQKKFFVDEFYDWSVVRANRWFARFCDGMDYWFWNGLVLLCGYMVLGISWVSRTIDEFVINLGFDGGCGGVSLSGRLLSRLQGGRVQNYLRVIGVALAALVLFLMWGCRSQ